MGDVLITIITKDSHIKLKRMLTSLSTNEDLKFFDVLIVDDSCLSYEIEKNIKNIQSIQKMNITYINKTSWDIIKRYMLSKLPKDQKQFLNKIVLGSKEWNTHNVRNIGQIIAKTMFKNKKYVMGMDDDMIVEKNFKLNYDNITKKKTILLGIRLKGCPDLSRIEWIKAYNRYMLHKKGEKIAKDTKDYINVLIDKIGMLKIGKKINAYTDIRVSNTKDNGTHDIMPLRECIHGGGYISNMKNLEEFPFPSFYNEDWYRFDQIKEKNKIAFRFIDQSIVHGASAKKILLKDKIFFEEEGEILKWYYYNGNSKKSFSLFANKKIAYLKHEITIAKKLIKLYNKHESTFKKIVSLLQETINLYMSFLQSKELVNKIERFNAHKKERVTFVGCLKNIDISEKILSEVKYTIKRIIISPHIDDALLSVGGYMLDGKDADALMICNICTLSTYTKDGIKGKDKVTLMRRREEENIQKISKIRSVDFGFEDAIVRIGSSEKEYINANYNADKDPVFYKVYEEIKRVSDTHQKSILFFPLSIGDHVDHKLMFEIGKKLYYQGYNVIFYEDVGYSQNLHKKYIQQHIQTTKMNLVPFLYVFDDIQRKMDVCKLYESQMDGEIIENIKSLYHALGGERMRIPKSLYTSLSSII